MNQNTKKNVILACPDGARRWKNERTSLRSNY
jgi:hypothetical protein